MAECFVAVCDLFLSCLQNVRVILMKKFSSFYLKHDKQAALSLILLVTFDVTLPYWRISKVGRINRTIDRQ